MKGTKNNREKSDNNSAIMILENHAYFLFTNNLFAECMYIVGEKSTVGENNIVPPPKYEIIMVIR